MPTQLDNRESARFLTIMIAGHEYLVNMSWVQSIERSEKLEQIQNENNKRIIGTYKSGNRSINIYSLNELLGHHGAEKTGSGRIVILRKKNLNLAIYADAVSGIVYIEGEQVYELPIIASKRLSEYFEKIAVYNDKIYFSILPESLEGIGKENMGRTSTGVGESSVIRKSSNGAGTISNVQRILLFRFLDLEHKVSDLTFGVSISQVLQILEPVEILNVPGSKEFVAGLINWRGRPVPLLDFAIRLGFKASDLKRHCRYLIMRTISHNQLIAFSVYEDVNVRKLPIDHSRSDMQLSFDSLYSKGVFKIDSGTLVIPGVDEIVFN